MAPSDALSPPGSASYSSNTLDVGDGTWVFTKNTFLLPNLVGLNFETMQYNGMGNRFSTLTEYHSLITGHGVLAAITFLFIIPIAVMTARFYRGRPGYAIKYHAYLQILAVGFTTVIFILGFIAVGPNRALTNPHHGIGVAIYVLILLQAIGGRLIRNIMGRSLRVAVHQWSGRAIALLGIVQIPLGLTLYGSPKFTFVLYALWMSFLVLLYFILNYRLEGEKWADGYAGGARSEAGRTQVTEVTQRKQGGGVFKWIAPVAAGAGLFALFRRNKNRDRSPSRERSRSRMRSRSRGRPEVIPSRRGSESFIEEEKRTETRRSGGGIMNKVLGVGAALGAGALVKGYMDRRERRRRDEEYSAVATDTPSRRDRLRRHGGPGVSEVSEETEITRHGRRTPLLPGPGNPMRTAEVMTAGGAAAGVGEPSTPRRSHRPGLSRVDTAGGSEYSSYVSPSRRPAARKNDGVGKGILAGIGLGWLAKRWQDRRGGRAEEREEEARYEEEQRRLGATPSRYTGDGHLSPSRRESRRLVRRPPTSAPGRGGAAASHMSEVSSSEIEPRPPVGGYGGPPMPPLGHGGAPPPPIVMGGQPGGPSTILPVGVPPARSRSRSRPGVVNPVAMPSMPPDPHGVLYHDSGSESYNSPGGHTHHRRASSSRRRRAGEAAAAAAVAGAGLVAAEEFGRRRAERAHEASVASASASGPGQPVSVKLKVHDDRNVTLRRLTEEEQAAQARRNRQQHQRANSASSLSGAESPSGSHQRHYRRDSSQRRAEAAAERMVGDPRSSEPLAPLSPPHPAFAGGGARRPKDSAYYSGQPVTPGPSGATPAAGATVSSFGSPGSHGTWSGVSPSPSGPGGRAAAGDPTASAADRRRRRRLERREGSRPTTTVDFE